jgi:hypothetical protein
MKKPERFSGFFGLDHLMFYRLFMIAEMMFEDVYG